MQPAQPLRPPVARFLATSNAWLKDTPTPSDSAPLPERELMPEHALMAHRRRLRALWIAQWQSNLQHKLAVRRDARPLVTHTD